MVARTEMIALSQDATLDQVVDVIERHQHSRYPVFHHSVDNIIGIVAAKRLLAAAAEQRGPGTFDVRQYMTPPLFIPETMPAYALLAHMRDQRQHCAVSVDEYGATAGLVTLRDLIDRLAGELPDETELDVPTIDWQADGSALVDGLAPVPEVEHELGIQLDGPEYHSLGGFVFGRLGRRPSVGDTIEVEDRTLKVEELDGLRIARVRVCRKA